MARSKTDSYLTAFERECIVYLTNIGLKGCPGCMTVRRGDLFKADGTCLWCHDEVTPELQARIDGDKAMVKRIRRKLARLKAKGKSNLTVVRLSEWHVEESEE